uniref:Uncharacterized protein n=1 Tax=Opuntia streptacantha TaxID=393608 RepID=A0A7C8Z5V7_OPUST
MFDVVKSPWIRPPSCNFAIDSPICVAISFKRSSAIPFAPISSNMSLTIGPSTNSNVRVCIIGSTEYSTGVGTPSFLAFVIHLASAFKRLIVSFESRVGCLYFFEKRSFIIHLLPTKDDSKTFASAPCFSRTRDPSWPLASTSIMRNWWCQKPKSFNLIRIPCE